MCFEHHCSHVFTNCVSDTNYIGSGRFISLGLWTFTVVSLPIPPCQIKGATKNPYLPFLMSYFLNHFFLTASQWTPVSKSVRTTDQKKTEFIRNSDTQTEIDECTGRFIMPSLDCSFKFQVTFTGREKKSVLSQNFWSVYVCSGEHTTLSLNI